MGKIFDFPKTLVNIGSVAGDDAPINVPHTSGSSKDISKTSSKGKVIQVPTRPPVQFGKIKITIMVLGIVLILLTFFAGVFLTKADDANNMLFYRLVWGFGMSSLCLAQIVVFFMIFTLVGYVKDHKKIKNKSEDLPRIIVWTISMVLIFACPIVGILTQWVNGKIANIFYGLTAAATLFIVMYCKSLTGRLYSQQKNNVTLSRAISIAAGWMGILGMVSYFGYLAGGKNSVFGFEFVFYSASVFFVNAILLALNAVLTRLIYKKEKISRIVLWSVLAGVMLILGVIVTVFGNMGDYNAPISWNTNGIVTIAFVYSCIGGLAVGIISFAKSGQYRRQIDPNYVKKKVKKDKKIEA